MTYSWYKLLFNMTKVESSKTLVWTSISYCNNNFHPPEYLAMSPFLFSIFRHLLICLSVVCQYFRHFINSSQPFAEGDNLIMQIKLGIGIFKMPYLGCQDSKIGKS